MHKIYNRCIKMQKWSGKYTKDHKQYYKNVKIGRFRGGIRVSSILNVKKCKTKEVDCNFCDKKIKKA